MDLIKMTKPKFIQLSVIKYEIDEMKEDIRHGYSKISISRQEIKRICQTLDAVYENLRSGSSKDVFNQYGRGTRE
jgi:hypothetical protein